MPLTVNVGLSKKIDLPAYGSLGASCHVGYEADSALLTQDLDGFHRQVKAAFVACRQAVQDELYRAQNGERDAPLPQNYGNGRSNGRPRSQGRRATASQVRAIQSLADRLQLDLVGWLQEKYGLRVPAELSIADASSAIDELKVLPTGNSGGHY